MSATTEDTLQAQPPTPSDDHPNIPSFCYRLPADLSSSIFTLFLSSASRDDIFNLLCTSESTYLFFSYLLYSKVTLDADKSAQFFEGCMGGEEDGWPLCPRAGRLSAKELSLVMPHVPESLCRHFVEFDPVAHHLTLGVNDVSEEKKEQTVGLLKKVLLCRSIRKMVIKDLAATNNLVDFITTVHLTFPDFPFYDTLLDVDTERLFAFSNVEWLVFDSWFASNVCQEWNIGLANDPVTIVVKEIRPPNICIWAPNAFKYQEVSIIPQALLNYGLADKIERLVIHRATICHLTRFYPAKRTEIYFDRYLNAADGSCQYCRGMAMPCRCCTDFYLDFFRMCFAGAATTWKDESNTSHPRSFEMHEPKVDKAKMLSLLGTLWSDDNMWSSAGDDRMLVHGPDEQVRCCEGCGQA
ncbi:hypothetical protein IAR50_003006 [Cryptococcus sp. DSM 104548]